MSTKDDKYYKTPTISKVDYFPSNSNEAEQSEFSLRTGHSVDYACFAIWNAALSKQSEIVADLAKNFDLIGDFEIHWSDQNYARNIARLYERTSGSEEFSGYDNKIGPPPFRLLIVRDPKPKYTWKQSVSGAIEPTNEAVVAAKYRYRGWFEKKYQIHSSNNISEFLIQIALLLGPDLAHDVLSAPHCVTEVLHRDLEGANGWESWRHLFSVLNFGCNYLVLRNFEGLPDRLEDGDIDFQCDNFQRLASAANMTQKQDRPFKGGVNVAGNTVSVDIRYVGDGYYPAVWQHEMLRRRRMVAGFYAPAEDDLFFSLLYHVKIQKPLVKPKYHPELAELAQALRFDWFDPAMLEDDEKCGRALAGYLRARRLNYVQPVDRGVFANGAVIQALPQEATHLSTSQQRYQTVRSRMKKALRQPELIAPYILKKIGFKKP